GPQVFQRHGLAAHRVVGHGDDDAGDARSAAARPITARAFNVGGPLAVRSHPVAASRRLLQKLFQGGHVHVAFERMVRRRVARFRDGQVHGPQAVAHDVGPGRVEVGVAHHRLAFLPDAAEQHVLRAPPLVGGDDVLKPRLPGHRLPQPAAVGAARVRFVAEEHARPLAVAHGAGAAVGQQVDNDLLRRQGEQIVAGFFNPAQPLLAAGQHERFYDFGAIRFCTGTHDTTSSVGVRPGRRGRSDGPRAVGSIVSCGQTGRRRSDAPSFLVNTSMRGSSANSSPSPGAEPLSRPASAFASASGSPSKCPARRRYASAPAWPGMYDNIDCPSAAASAKRTERGTAQSLSTGTFPWNRCSSRSSSARTWRKRPSNMVGKMPATFSLLLTCTCTLRTKRSSTSTARVDKNSHTSGTSTSSDAANALTVKSPSDGWQSMSTKSYSSRKGASMPASRRSLFTV